MSQDEDHELIAALRALPREIEPPADLWPRIAARVSEPVQRSGHRRWWLGAGVAAAVAVATVGMLTTMHDDPRAPVVTVGDASSVVVTVDPGVRFASESVIDAMTGPGADELSQETLDLVRENLRIIDQALREITEALEIDPDNTQLQRQLLDTYRGHARLIEDVMRMQPGNGMRTDI